MSFTDEAWQAIAPIRRAIDNLPFVRSLESGQLDRERFVYYLGQDSHFLTSYGRALALAASQGTTASQVAFWAGLAHTTMVDELLLHRNHLEDIDIPEPSPTCAAYASYLLSLASCGNYPVLVAGLVPCMWIYDDVGTRMLERLGSTIENHPYADWIMAYGDPEFAAACVTVRAITDELAAAADPLTRDAMHTAFHTAARHEWMFWDDAQSMRSWPV